MRKFFCFLLVAAVCACAVYEIKSGDLKDLELFDDITQERNVTEKVTEVGMVDAFEADEEMRAVWLTYSEIGAIVKNKTEKEYRASLEKLFANLIDGKINTAFYQARAFCDAFYESDIFPASKYIISSGEAPSYDPFMIFTELSKKYDINVHAWVNPFRVSYSSDYKLLPENSPAVSLYEKDKNNLIICDEGIYLNPGCENVRELVISGVKEIVEKYDIAGIHFDDYFYPESDNLNDEMNYDEYKKQGGTLSLSDWRRENVTSLIGSIYSFLKMKNDSLLFGVSPSGDIDKCTDIYYADVKKWCSCEEYIDYVIPQIYYGFDNSNISFLQCAKAWEAIADTENIKLICGLAVYKCGQIDENAGTGINEWADNEDVLFKQYKYITDSDSWNGFSYFSYSYSFGEKNDNSKKEIKKISNMVE